MGVTDNQINLSEHERELAMLRALGFSNVEIGYILAGELILPILVALPVGCVLGHGLAWIIAQRLDTELYRVPLITGPRTYAAAISVVLLATLTSTWIVVRQASHLDILGILRARQ